MATPFGPQLIGETEKTLGAVLTDTLRGTGLSESQWVTLRVPYPLGFYSRGLDGRIDDPKGGWKGRALYANYGTHFVWHIEGGKGTRGKVVKFQLRPDPLAN